jgi:hypothetical protein
VVESEPSNGFQPLLHAPPSGYDVYALAADPSRGLNDGKVFTPPEQATNRMFGPVSDALDPKRGGLGIYAPDFFQDANQGRDLAKALKAQGYYVKGCSWTG